MPKLYFIVRHDSTTNSKPSCRTVDISVTGMPFALESDKTRLVETYTVVDEEASDGPWVYRVAIETIKMPGKGLHITYGSASRNDVFHRFQKMPTYIDQGEAERQRSFAAITQFDEEKVGDNEDEGFRAEVAWSGQTCVRIRFRKKSYCWYEFMVVEVEDRARLEGQDEEETGGGGNRKRRKREVEEAAGEDTDIFDDEVA